MGEVEHWKQLAQDRRRSEDLSSLMAKILLYVVSYVSCFSYFSTLPTFPIVSNFSVFSYSSYSSYSKRLGEYTQLS